MSAESALRGMRKPRAIAKGRPRLGLIQNEGVLSSESVAHNSIRCVVIELSGLSACDRSPQVFSSKHR